MLCADGWLGKPLKAGAKYIVNQGSASKEMPLIKKLVWVMNHLRKKKYLSIIVATM